MSYDYFNQGPKVKMTIVSHILKKNSIKRRNRPEVKAGTKVFGIKYSSGGYVPYLYATRELAQRYIDGSIQNGTNNEYYKEFNVKQELEPNSVVAD